MNKLLKSQKKHIHIF